MKRTKREAGELSRDSNLTGRSLGLFQDFCGTDDMQCEKGRKIKRPSGEGCVSRRGSCEK